MKRLLLCSSALLFTLGMANAQISASGTGAQDDFAGTTEYTDITWSADAAVGGSSMTISRPGDGTMVIDAVSIGKGTDNQWPTFRVTFGQALDLSDFADIVFDIQNTNASVKLFGKIELEDGSGNKAGIEPNISDVTSSLAWGDQVNGKYPRKAVNGFVLDASSRGTFTIDLSSVPTAVGGLTRTGWVGTGGCNTDGPYCGPVTAYQIDPSDIVAVIFTINYFDDSYAISMGTEGGDHTDDYLLNPLDAAGFTGDIIIHDFKIGDGIAGTNDASVIDASLKVYPNPANEVLSVAFESVNNAEVSLTDVVGNKVYSASAVMGENKMTLNTSTLSSGMYILNISTENGTVARKVTIK